MDPVVKDNDHLKEMKDKRCQLLVAARIKKDPKIGTYDTEKFDEEIGDLIKAEKNMKLDGNYGKCEKIQ
ncbi:hypothetical protein HanHA300_Chr02g0067881 [Helianthus annuus]|nr:hypothetical protein HanHA300_Chr02g0067881 [Helianthus annuus]